MWMVSVALFGVSLLYSLWFLHRKTQTTFLILLLLLGISSMLYYLYNKKIEMPGGYTAVQAWLFYRCCKKEGLKTTAKFFSDLDAQKRVIQKFDFSKELDQKSIRRLYDDGIAVEKSMKKKNTTKRGK